ncbi:MAG TPA: protein kinase [Gemmatimonadota bacterium]|nr:protein kinase [Gemmatimonadota bacterium]
MIERLREALSDRYRIEGEIGEGGMATVYLAEDLRHARKVAVKVLKPELAAVIGAERFLVEIQTTAGLQHPHILPLFDSGKEEGFLYYVMPYVEGESLRDRIDRERQLPVKDAVRLARGVADALDYAHRRDVVHRDIKPENILLHEGNPVVADFGIALALSAAGGGRMTETGLSLGTPHYMSPEQVSATKDLDARSDIYSLGAVLYEMLTGDPPHTGPTAQAVLMRILTEEPRPVTQIRSAVPAHVLAVIAKALEKLPADRFASAGELREALDDPSFTYERAGVAAVAGQGAGPRADGSPWWRRGPAIAAAALGLLLLVSAGLAVRASQPAAPPGPVARFPVDLGELGTPTDLALSPDGSSLVFASGTSIRERSLYIRRSDDPTPRRIPDTEGAGSPVFSPEGDWLAFVVDREIRRMPAGGGPAAPIVSRATEIGQIHWGDDGSIVFADPRGIHRVPAAGGEVETLLAGAGPEQYRLPRLLPGGEALLFTDAGSIGVQSSVRVLDLGSGEEREVVADASDAHWVAPGHLLVAGAAGALFAVPFDPDARKVTGPRVPVLDSVVIGRWGDAQFALSAGGTAAYVVGSPFEPPTARLVSVDLEGGETPIRLPERAGYSAPRYSPDGRRIAYQLLGDVWVYDTVLGSRDSISTGGTRRNPVWSPDGSSVVYTVLAGDSTRFDVRPADLSAPPRTVASVGAASAWTTDWTPSGDRIVFTVVQGDQYDIWTAEVDGGAARPYLRADGWTENAGEVSPDGRWAAYESNEDGRYEVFVRSFHEPGARHRVSPDGGIGPRWAAGGTRLFYRKGDSVKVATVRADSAFEVLRVEDIVAGPYRGVEPHPDGTSFLAMKRPTVDPEDILRGDDRRLVFVVNWIREMRARLEP